jgi:hypothetical protein
VKAIREEKGSFSGISAKIFARAFCESTFKKRKAPVSLTESGNGGFSISDSPGWERKPT